MEEVILAAGKFWGVQHYLDQIPGVVSTTVGYTGGSLENPTYEDVCTQKTGHAEAVLVEFKTHELSFEDLCRHFFRLHDPTLMNRQGPDIGVQYRSGIFYVTDAQHETAEKVRDEVQKQFKEPIVTVIEKAGPFYQAEDEHQKYAERTGQGMSTVPYEPLKSKA